MRGKRRLPADDSSLNDDRFAFEEAGDAGAHAAAQQPDAAGPLVDDDVSRGRDAGLTAEQREANDLRERYLRLAADFENFRRRVAKERIEERTRSQADLARQLLDPLDDLARFAHLDPHAVDAVTVVEGAQMVEKKLLKVLAVAGLTLVNPVDQPFDPAQHEAVATEPAPAPEDDHMVARVYQPGYLFNGQLLRAAKVVVKQWAG